MTAWMEARANELLAAGLTGVARLGFAQARRAATTHAYDFIDTYVADLGGGHRPGIDPRVAHSHGRRSARRRGRALLGAHRRIATGLDLHVVNDAVDPTFRFMTLDWDGKIRMDPSSPYAMRRLIALKDRYDIAFACDTDHDRHGIVTASGGLLPANHYLSVAIDYLFRHRPKWKPQAGVGKTVVSSAMIDRVAARLGRPLYEVPVGFKWFVAGLLDGRLGIWRRGKRRRLVPRLRRRRVEHRQGRDRAGAAVRRDHRAHRPRSRAGLSGADSRPGRAVRRSHRSARHTGAEEAARQARPLAGAQHRTRRRADRAGPDARARQSCPHRRTQGLFGRRLVRRAALRHRGYLQDLRRELSQRSALREILSEAQIIVDASLAAG